MLSAALLLLAALMALPWSDATVIEVELEDEPVAEQMPATHADRSLKWARLEFA